jgi:hypothetical protein
MRETKTWRPGKAPPECPKCGAGSCLYSYHGVGYSCGSFITGTKTEMDLPQPDLCAFRQLLDVKGMEDTISYLTTRLKRREAVIQALGKRLAVRGGGTKEEHIAAAEAEI